MAHGKETPRQKMIGMMYLVLTAMLALNVQKEVLKAFVRIDESLVKTVKNYTQKNKMIYDDFAAKYLANQQKVEKWKSLADETHVKADALFNMVQDMKMAIIHRAEGTKTEAIEGDEIILDNVKRPDNMDSPAVVMYGDHNNGQGRVLKAEMVKFREWLLEHIDPDASSIRDGVAKSLDTSDPRSKEGEINTWEAENFEHLPLAGVIAIMSGMQANIRNAESDMIRYLYSQIDAKDYKVNKLEATVIPNSKFVFKGNEYRAKIFLAASDSTQKPVIYIGKVDSAMDANGNWGYKMARVDDSIQAGDDGKALYSRRVGSVGEFNYEGLLQLTNADGNKTNQFFREEYNVIEGIYGVNPTKMNVIFIGVDNPLEVYVSGVAAEKIKATSTNGTISPQRDGSWIARPKSVGNCLIQVFAEVDGKNQSMGYKEFRVMLVPSPVAKVGGKNGGVMNKEVLLAQKAIIADLENFYFDLEFKIVEYTVSSTVRGFTKEIEKKGNAGALDNEVKDFIRNLNKGQTVYFQNVKAVGPDGDVRRLNTIDIKLN